MDALVMGGGWRLSTTARGRWSGSRIRMARGQPGNLWGHWRPVPADPPRVPRRQAGREGVRPVPRPRAGRRAPRRSAIAILGHRVRARGGVHPGRGPGQHWTRTCVAHFVQNILCPHGPDALGGRPRRPWRASGRSGRRAGDRRPRLGRPRPSVFDAGSKVGDPCRAGAGPGDLRREAGGRSVQGRRRWTRRPTA